jgi:asparagine synthase (glutamine-hydrolysing)
MSGFVGIVNTDGAPIDRRLLTDMTDALAFRGPDAQRVWIDGNVGFGHTLLATTEEAWSERQPCSLDGDVWLTADARIDGRDDLVAALGAAGREARGANDAELILHAYGAWGDRSVDRLLGDFAFAVWDRSRRTLFCVRDPLGTKPFFYAERSGTIVVSNTLECVRRHPAVSDRLDDVAVADFLLFQGYQEFDTTAFCDVRRLPGAHALTWSADAGARVRRYWTLPVGREIRYRRRRDYVEHFGTLLKAAVRDRVRTPSVGVMMSGGLDSTTIAAVARDAIAEVRGPATLRASSIVYDTLIPDQERHYSGLAARSLGIPIDYLEADGYVPFDRSDGSVPRAPEPADESFPMMMRDYYRRLASYTRVALCGFEGDELFDEVPRTHFAALARSGQIGRLGSALVTYSRAFGVLPHIGVRTAWRRWVRGAGRMSAFPAWLNEDFVKRLDLRARWRAAMAPKPAGVTRPRAIHTLTSPVRMQIVESFDTGVTRAPLEVRHPLEDRRLIDYVLAIPAVPWCMRKTLLRETMRGVLPEPVRRRPKVPLAGSPLVEWLKRPDAARRLGSIALAPQLEAYVDVAKLTPLAGQSPADDVYLSVYLRLRPLSLSYWLHA